MTFLRGAREIKRARHGEEVADLMHFQGTRPAWLTQTRRMQTIGKAIHAGMTIVHVCSRNISMPMHAEWARVMLSGVLGLGNGLLALG
jgi:hypothetical protein